MRAPSKRLIVTKELLERQNRSLLERKRQADELRDDALWKCKLAVARERRAKRQLAATQRQLETALAEIERLMAKK